MYASHHLYCAAYAVIRCAQYTPRELHNTHVYIFVEATPKVGKAEGGRRRKMAEGGRRNEETAPRKTKEEGRRGEGSRTRRALAFFLTIQQQKQIVFLHHFFSVRDRKSMHIDDMLAYIEQHHVPIAKGTCGTPHPILHKPHPRIPHNPRLHTVVLWHVHD
jgi:hypothetical protein